MALEPCPQCNSKAVCHQGCSPTCYVLCNECGYTLLNCVSEEEAAYKWNYEARDARADMLFMAIRIANTNNPEADNWRFN